VITLRDAADRLAEAGVPSPMYDARALLQHAAEQHSDPEQLLAARQSRVPLQHLLGTAGFRYLELAVGPGVFIPRPETELLVDEVLRSIADMPTPRVVDLCAGSGAIGLSVAQEQPRATVDLVEASAAAIEWLRRNSAGRERVTVHLADLADAPVGADGMIDVVVSNPPYVPLDERDLVDPEVRDHDPAEALWGGEDGLDTLRRVVDRARTLLRPSGRLVVEHSDRQGESVPELFTNAGFADVADHLDLTGRSRYTTGIWMREASQR
jgi:release factor glutamine methyltransferase